MHDWGIRSSCSGAIAIQRNPDWSRAASKAGQSSWASLQQGAASANENALKPAWAKIVEWDRQFFDYIDPPKVASAKPKPAKLAAAPAKVCAGRAAERAIHRFGKIDVDNTANVVGAKDRWVNGIGHKLDPWQAAYDWQGVGRSLAVHGVAF